MEVIEVVSKLKEYIIVQIDVLAKNNPIIGMAKPFIVRVVDKKFSKIDSFLEYITDEKGNIDVEPLLDDFIEVVEKQSPFTTKIDYIGEVEVGNSAIKFNIPMVDKKISISTEDLKDLKEFIITK